MGDVLIDVVIRHGGRMDFSGSEPRYVGGEESVVGFDTDYLSYRTLNAVAKEDLGYTIVHRMWWLPPKKTMSSGLRELFGDNDILYGLMIDVKKVEDGHVVMFFEAEREVSGGWDNEVGNLGDDEGYNSDDDDGADMSVRSPILVLYDDSGESVHGNDPQGKKRRIRTVCYSSGGEEVQQCSSLMFSLAGNSGNPTHLSEQAVERSLSDNMSDSVESNVCESFNNAITKFRDLRIIKLLEGIRTYAMVRMVDQHKAFAAMRDVICPTISYMRYDVTEYVEKYYTVHLAKKAYTKGVPPLPGREDWVDVEGLPVLPPPQKVMPGRPKKNRRKEPGEVSTRPSRTGVGKMMRKTGAVMHCSRCGHTDHNVRGCKMTDEEVAAIPPPPPPRPVGRPRRTPIEEQQQGEANDQPARRRKIRCKHCKHFGHNIRGCPVRRGVQPGSIGRNTPRPVVEREIRQAMRGVGVHISPDTGNQYFATGAGVRLQEVDMNPDIINQSQQPGTQPPNTQPRSTG
ncbi:hypothetical protein LINPERPRIM_LOCUS483 [Linum perenne]